MVLPMIRTPVAGLDIDSVQRFRDFRVADRHVIGLDQDTGHVLCQMGAGLGDVQPLHQRFRGR